MPPLNTKEKAYVREWLDLTQHDVRAAAYMYADNTVTFGYLITYVARQATEKFVKAARLTQGLSFPKTHDIPALLVLLDPYISFAPIDYVNAAVLADYAVEVRYPGKRINKSELQTAVQMARQSEARLAPFIEAALL